jgi:hypothetical protein
MRLEVSFAAVARDDESDIVCMYPTAWRQHCGTLQKHRKPCPAVLFRLLWPLDSHSVPWPDTFQALIPTVSSNCEKSISPHFVGANQLLRTLLDHIARR